MKMSEIIDMRNNGATYQEIADAVGLSKQRVREIILKHSPELKGTRGSALRRANDQVNRLQAEIERYKGVIKLLENDVKEAQAELKEFKALYVNKVAEMGIKAFAERLKAKTALKSHYHKLTNQMLETMHEAIDNLVKEMTGQAMGYGSSKMER